MTKQAVSVTLGAENLTWLKGRVKGGGAKSVSDLLDQLVSKARASGAAGSARSVVATIDIDQADPMLDQADAAVRELFEQSIGRPFLVRERRTAYGTRGRPTRRG